MQADIGSVEIIAPNFKRRLSGVTSTIVQLIPAQVARGVKIATVGPGLPDGLPKLAYRDLLKLRSLPQGRRTRIWHARRNTEMLAGIVLKHVLRMPLKLVFTSAAQRRHTRYTRFLISKMDAVIATSGRSGSYLKVPYTVVMHGIDLERFRPPVGEETDWSTSGLPGRFGIGCFGRIRKQKGTDLFVESMIRLLPFYPEWTAAIFGRVTADNRGFADALIEKIERAGLSDRIRFMGEVPDVKPWLRRVAVCVAPSRNEGFGLTPLEAMASLSAVVASDAGAYAELIDPGVTGFVAPAGDGPALTEAIERYMADPALARAHAEAGLTRVHARFALDREAQGIRAVYDRVFATP